MNVHDNSIDKEEKPCMLRQNRTEQNRTEQNRTEQNRTEQNRRNSTLDVLKGICIIFVVITHYK